MAGTVVEVVQGGRIVRLNLSEPMVPGVTFARKGVTYRVSGDGETAEPVSAGGTQLAGLSPEAIPWLIGIAVVWYFLVKRS